jgi:hypothetical protein
MKILTWPIATTLLAFFTAISIAPAVYSQARDPGTGTVNPIPPGTTEILPAGSNSSINQQAGVIQNNGVGSYGNLSYPACSGVCVFAIGRVNHTGNSNPSMEAVVGAVWQINSPENTPAQNACILAENQRDALTKKLAEAIENKKPERANAIAIILAQRLGYSDY